MQFILKSSLLFLFVTIKAIKGISILRYFLIFYLKNTNIKIADPDLLNNSLYNLQNKILDGYNAFIRPVSNPNTTTFINVDLTLKQVLVMVNIFY